MTLAHWQHKCLLIFWMLLLTGLGIRTLATGDSRWGWGMFKEQVNYKLKYYWIMEDGTTRQYKTGRELKGRANKNLKSKKPRNSRYGHETVRRLVQAYVRTPNDIRPHIKDAVGFRAVMTYRINKHGSKQSETFEHYFIADK